MRLGGMRACRALALGCVVGFAVFSLDGRAGLLDEPADPWGLGLAASDSSARLVVETKAINRGDTLMDLLLESGIERSEAERAIKALARYYSPRTLQIGQALTVVLDRGIAGEDHRTLLAMGLSIGEGRHVVAERVGDGFQGRRGEDGVDVASLAQAVVPPIAPSDPRGVADAIGAPNDAVLEKLVIGRGDTLLGRLVDAGAEPGDALAASKALAEHVDVRALRIGEEVSVFWNHGAEARLVAVGVARGDDMVTASRGAAGGYRVGQDTAALSLAVPGLTVPDAVGGAASEHPKPIARGRIVVEKTLSVGRGDTLVGLLRATGVDRGEAAAALQALARIVSPRALQIGDRVTVTYEPSPDGAADKLVAVTLDTAEQRVRVEQGAEGSFAAERLAAEPNVPPLPPNAAPKIASSWRLVPDHKPEPGQRRPLIEQVFEIGPGDTLHQILAGAGVGETDARAASKALRSLVDPRRLQVGQEVTVILDPLDFVSGRPRLLGLSVERRAGDFAIASRVDGDFEVRVDAAPATSAAYADLPAPAPVPVAAVEPVTVAAPLPPEPLSLEGSIVMPFTVRKGDTLLTALTEAGVAGDDAKAAIEELRRVFNPRRLRPGQTISIAFAAPGDGTDARFVGLSLTVEPGKIAEVVRAGAAGFRAYERASALTGSLVRAEGVIESSLYQAAADADVPSEVMNDLILAFSYDVDFQRELRAGDRFEVLFEAFADADGSIVRYGSPLYASLEVAGHAIPIYLYAPPGESPDYFHADGQSVRKALLRTPINGARVTSSFGKRKDPFQGYTKMHKGIDFGAPKGTPVLAAGDGVVEYAGKFSGYGNYVRIRHGDSFKTAYAHMSKYGPGIKKGARVSQGQIIGYVGCTGRCTGNHLHYEVIVAGKQVDPNGVDLPTGRKLDGVELAAFFEARIAMDQQFAALASATRIAGQ